MFILSTYDPWFILDIIIQDNANFGYKNSNELAYDANISLTTCHVSSSMDELVLIKMIPRITFYKNTYLHLKLQKRIQK